MLFNAILKLFKYGNRFVIMYMYIDTAVVVVVVASTLRGCWLVKLFALVHGQMRILN